MQHHIALTAKNLIMQAATNYKPATAPEVIATAAASMNLSDVDRRFITQVQRQTGLTLQFPTPPVEHGTILRRVRIPGVDAGFEESEHPRVPAGSPEGGEFTSGEGGGGGTATATAPAHARGAKPLNDIQRRAKASYVESTKERQHIADTMEDRVAAAVGTVKTADNSPFDVVVGRHGIEVKTIIDTPSDEIRMRKEPLARKREFASEHNLTAVTVIVDYRPHYARGENPVTAQPKVYFAEKLGNLVITNRTPLKNGFHDIKALLK
jgi:hypothetical protein